MADTKLGYTLSLGNKSFVVKMQEAEGQVNKLDKKFNKLDDTIGKIGKGFAAFFALDKLKDFAIGVVMATASVNSFENAILASSRTQGEGRANLSFLNTQVDRLGLNLEAARAGYKTFTGAVMGSNIQGAKSNRIFRQVSEASAVLGLSAEQTEGSFLALGQMISKGNVQAEELRGQLAERIPGAFQIGARAMGISTKQLGDDMKEGLIKADDFLVKFGNELEKTFGSKLDGATGSVQANLNKMSNEWIRLQENIGKSNTGIISSVTSWTTGILKEFNKVISALNKVDLAFSLSGKKAMLEFGNIESIEFGVSSFNKFASEHRYSMPWLSLMSPGSFLPNQKGDKEKMMDLQQEVGSKFVEPSTVSARQSYLAEAGILNKKIALRKDLSDKKISQLFYDRSAAIFDTALAEVIGNRTLLDNTAKGNGGSAGAGGSAIGSPTEISGARAQNVTINIHDGLVKELNIITSSMEGGAMSAKESISKYLLEVLNDANTIANR